MCSFQTANTIAAFLHLANTVATFIVADHADYELTQTYASWESVDEFCPNNETIAWNFTGSNGTFAVYDVEKTTYSLSLFWLIAWFHGLSFVFQFGGSFLPNYISDIEQRGVNTFRMVEYSISATLMLVCIALVSGIRSVYFISGMSVLCFATQAFGAFAELMFDDLLTDPYFKKIGWAAHACGWITMGSSYGMIIAHFFFTQANSPVNAPDFVVAIIWSIAVLFNIFGFTQLTQLCLKDPCCGSFSGYSAMRDNPKRDNITVETFYIVNSFVSKTILGWLIIANTTMSPDKIKC